MLENRFFRHELAGGLVLVGERVPDRRSVAVGIWLGVGSRDEAPGLEGVAHFVEHMVFKGTRRRSARDIAVSLERVGGSLDAFTTKESTCYFARVLEEDLELAVDVLADLVAEPRFAPEDIERERHVVIDELRGVEDAPEDLIGDLAMERLWPGHVMGSSILGTEASLAALDAGRVAAFHGASYRTRRAVVAATGAVDPGRLVPLVERAVRLPAEPAPPARRPPDSATASLALYPRDAAQVHLTLFTPAPAFEDPDRPAAQLLAEIFGGGMSSRLFQKIREELGIAYSVYAFSEHFEDCGQFGVVLSVSPDRAPEAVGHTLAEMRRFLDRGLEADELASALAQVRGSLVMGEESLTSRMLGLAASEYRLRRRETLEQKLRPFLAVGVEDVHRLAGRLLDPAAQNLVVLGPCRRRDFDTGGFAAVHVAGEPR